MINEDKTFEKYGYRSTDLSKCSHKLIVALCDNCDAVRYLQKNYYRALCAKCAHINAPSGKDHYKWVDNPKNVCEWCGKEYSVSVGRASISRFCSRECYVDMVSSNGKNNPNWRGGKISYICEVCGKEFFDRPAVDRKYCSRECASVGKIGKLCGENSPNWTGGEVSHTCEWCGKEFFAHLCDHRRFCSWECSGKYKSKYIVGELSGNWRGGIAFLPYCAKFNEKFKEKIRDSFGRKCFICGMNEEFNGQKLSVHHVSYNKDCLCDGAECEFVPLCQKCHTRTNYNRFFWERTIMYALEYIELYNGVDMKHLLLLFS